MFSRVFGIPQRYGLTAFRNGVASFAFDLKAGEPYRSLTRFSKFYNLKKKKGRENGIVPTKSLRLGHVRTNFLLFFLLTGVSHPAMVKDMKDIRSNPFCITHLLCQMTFRSLLVSRLYNRACYVTRACQSNCEPLRRPQTMNWVYFLTSILLSISSSSRLVKASDNGLAITPQMGWVRCGQKQIQP